MYISNYINGQIVQDADMNNEFVQLLDNIALVSNLVPCVYYGFLNSTPINLTVEISAGAGRHADVSIPFIVSGQPLQITCALNNATTVTIPANATGWIVINSNINSLSSGSYSYSTTDTIQFVTSLSPVFPAGTLIGQIPLYQVVSGALSITSITDMGGKGMNRLAIGDFLINNKIINCNKPLTLNSSLTSINNGWIFTTSSSARNGATANFPANNVQTSFIAVSNLIGGIETTMSSGNPLAGNPYSRIVTSTGMGNRYKMQTSGAGGSPALDGDLLIDTDLFTSANSTSTFIYNCFGLRKGLDNFFTISGDIVMTDAGASTFLATIPFANINLAGKTLAQGCRGPVWLSNAVFSYGTTAPYHASIGGATGASELNVLIQFSGAGASSVIASFSVTFSTN